MNDYIVPEALEEGSHNLVSARKNPGNRPLRLTKLDGRLSLLHASVKDRHVFCTNGVLLFIDSLILPIF